MVASLAGLWLLPPIPQNQDYHQFADQRTLFGIPNFWNVVSNLPFIAIGAVGLLRCRDDLASTMIFAGIFLTGFGSSYYHWNPNDDTLFWDRLPMTLAFSAILATAVANGSTRKPARSCCGRCSRWACSACSGGAATGDLRLYGWVQFFPCLALPVMFVLFPPKYTGTFYWIVAAVLYALAKLFEYQDGAIYSAGHLLSGHTLKHLAAAGACFAILRYYQTRKPIA